MKIIYDVWYKWKNSETRTEIDVLIEDENGVRSIATVNVEDYSEDIRFAYNEEEPDEIQNDNEIYELAREVAYDLGYELAGYAEDKRKEVK